MKHIPALKFPHFLEKHVHFHIILNRLLPLVDSTIAGESIDFYWHVVRQVSPCSFAVAKGKICHVKSHLAQLNSIFSLQKLV